MNYKQEYEKISKSLKDSNLIEKVENKIFKEMYYISSGTDTPYMGGCGDFATEYLIKYKYIIKYITNDNETILTSGIKTGRFRDNDGWDPSYYKEGRLMLKINTSINDEDLEDDLEKLYSAIMKDPEIMKEIEVYINKKEAEKKVNNENLNLLSDKIDYLDKRINEKKDFIESLQNEITELEIKKVFIKAELKVESEENKKRL